MNLNRRVSTIALLVVVSLSFCHCQTAHAAITDGIIAYWPFDSNANDYVGGNDGVLQGSASYVTGKIGQAVACNNNGASDWVLLTSEGTKDGDWTTAAWVNMHAKDTGGLLAGTDMSIRLCQHGATTNPGLSNVHPDVNVNGAWDGSDSQTSDYNIPLEKWVLLVFVGRDTDATPDGTTDEVELYANNVSSGKLVFAEVTGTDGSSSGTAIEFLLTWDRIGNLKGYPDYGDSVKDIDEVAIWDRSLSTGEVAELWNSGAGIPLTRDHYLGFTQSASNGPEDGAIASIEVEMSPPLTSGTVTINYTVTDIDTDSDDYSPHLASGILTFTSGVATQTVNLTILDDTEPEAQEQLQITLSGLNAGGEDVGMGPATHVYTIQANTEGINIPPVANDQSYSMRAAELMALPILLAGTDADHDPLIYNILTGPFNGTLTGTAPRLEYLSDSTFRGQETITYKVVDDSLAESNIGTVTIDVIEEPCTSAQSGSGYGGSAPTDSLFVHVPSHLVTADISTNQHTVTVTGDTRHESASSDPAVAGHTPFVSRNDLTNKTISIDLDTASINVPLSISFKLMPTSDTQNEIIMQSNAFVIEDDAGGITSTYYDNAAGQTIVTNNNSTLKTRSCNHFAVVLGSSLHKTYLNGYLTQQAANTSNLRDIDGTITIGPYPGKVWDIRIYDRLLTPTEIKNLGGDECSDDLLLTTPYPDKIIPDTGALDPNKPNYLIGVYVSEWWPDHAPEPYEEFQYYLHAQDKVYERNLFEGGMYPPGELSAYFATNNPIRSLELGDGIRSFMWATFSNPLTQSNCDYWMHENFHSYQGRLGGYTGSGMSKFMLESGASWGPDHMIPGKRDTLLAYYSMHPHLPWWTTQSSPVDMRAGWEFKGGHQYGAYILWSYFANHVANKMWVGDVHRTPGHPQAAHDHLAVQGHDLAPHFGDYAARITTWDIQDGAAYAAAEQASLSRMIGAKPEAPRHDNKITTTYGSAGTGNVWTSVPELYLPGSWAFNAYKVENITTSGDYIAAINTDMTNPAFSDFEARVVVHNTGSGVRTYHVLDVGMPGQVSTLRFPVSAGNELYLVIATTPDVFSGWDWYRYQYKIYPEPDEIDPPTPNPMTWATPPYATSFDSIAMLADIATDASGVEYKFTCTAGGGNDSEWQDGTFYEDTGLLSATQYTYTVTARDKSNVQNTTAPSPAESATTDGTPPITASLEGYWPFDGDALDSSGNDHDGTPVNAPGYTTGKLGQAIDLNGPSNQYLTAANPTSISPPWTVSVWVNKQGPPQSNNASGLLDGGTGADWTGLRAEQNGSDTPPKVGITKYVNPGFHNHYWDYSLPTGSWAHLVFVCTTTGTELYVDGVSQGELTSNGDSMLVWIDWIGKTHTYKCPMDAYLDDLAVWSRTLTTTEIDYLYNGGAGNAVGTGGSGSDLSGDGQANAVDFAIFARNWLRSDCLQANLWCDGSDFNGDNSVDESDLEEFAVGWLGDSEPDPSLMLHLDLDETAGTTANDSSDNGRHGTLTNMAGTEWTTDPTHGNVLSINGGDDYIDIIGYKGISGGASRTCAAWIKVASASDAIAIISWGDAGAGNRWLLKCDSTDGSLLVNVGGGYVKGTTNVCDNTWHHVAVTFENDGTPDIMEAKFYVDGVEDTISSSTSQEVITSGSGNNVYIGKYTGGSFNGLIDDVRIYDVALSEPEIADLAN